MLFVSFFVLIQIGVQLCTSTDLNITTINTLNKIVTKYYEKIKEKPDVSTIIDINDNHQHLSHMFIVDYMFIMKNIIRKRYQEIQGQLKYEEIYKIRTPSFYEKHVCDYLPRSIDAMYILTGKISLLDKLYNIYIDICVKWLKHVMSECYNNISYDTDYYYCHSTYLRNYLFLNYKKSDLNTLIYSPSETTNTQFITDVYNTVNKIKSQKIITNNHLDNLEFISPTPNYKLKYEAKNSDILETQLCEKHKTYCEESKIVKKKIFNHLMEAVEFFIKYIMVQITGEQYDHTLNKLEPIVLACKKIPMIMLFVANEIEDNNNISLYFTLCDSWNNLFEHCPLAHNENKEDSSSIAKNCMTNAIQNRFETNWLSIKNDFLITNDSDYGNEDTLQNYVSFIEQFYEELQENSNDIKIQLFQFDIEWLTYEHIFNIITEDKFLQPYEVLINKSINLYTEGQHIKYMPIKNLYFLMHWNLNTDYVYKHHAIIIHNIDQILTEYFILHVLLLDQLKKKRRDITMEYESFEWYTSIKDTYLYNYLCSSPMYESINIEIIDILTNDKIEKKFEMIQQLNPSKKFDMFSKQQIFKKPLLFDNDISNIITSIQQICEQGIQFINSILNLLFVIFQEKTFMGVEFECNTLTLDYFTTKPMEETRKSTDSSTE